MSNRSLVEINHDYPMARNDGDVLRWARQILRYIGNGDSRELPQGMALKHFRHHSDPDPMEVSAELIAAKATLMRMKYSHTGGKEWRPPIGKKPNFDLLATKDAEIAAIRAERDRLEEALAQISRMTLFPDDKVNRVTLWAAIKIARAAKEEAQ